MDYSVHLNGCCVLVLAKNLLPRLKLDVMAALRFAQLTADEDFSEDVDGQEWNKGYIETLSACGWTCDLQKKTSGKLTSATESAFSLEKAVSTVLENNVADFPVAAYLQALDKVAGLPEQSQAVQAFHEQAASKANGKTRVRVWMGVIDEQRALKMTSIFFDVRESGGWLFAEKRFELDKLIGELHANYYAARFDANDYDEYREDIEQWLDSRGQLECPEIASLNLQ